MSASPRLSPVADRTGPGAWVLLLPFPLVFATMNMFITYTTDDATKWAIVVQVGLAWVAAPPLSVACELLLRTLADR